MSVGYDTSAGAEFYRTARYAILTDVCREWDTVSTALHQAALLTSKPDELREAVTDCIESR